MSQELHLNETNILRAALLRSSAAVTKHPLLRCCGAALHRNPRPRPRSGPAASAIVRHGERVRATTRNGGLRRVYVYIERRFMMGTDPHGNRRRQHLQGWLPREWLHVYWHPADTLIPATLYEAARCIVNLENIHIRI